MKLFPLVSHYYDRTQQYDARQSCPNCGYVQILYLHYLQQGRYDSFNIPNNSMFSTTRVNSHLYHYFRQTPQQCVNKYEFKQYKKWKNFLVDFPFSWSTSAIKKQKWCWRKLCLKIFVNAYGCLWYSNTNQCVNFERRIKLLSLYRRWLYCTRV